jgi:hypothetical protein
VLPKLPGVFGVRASGYIAANDQPLRVEYYTYLRASSEPDEGFVVEQVFATTAGPWLRLGAGIGALAGAVEDAYIAHIGATADDVAAAVTDHVEQMRRYLAAGPMLSGEQRRFLATALSMWDGIAAGHPPPIESLGYTDKATFNADLSRLRDQLGRDMPDLSQLDWSRIQFLAEVSWASDMCGAGVEFALASPFTDPEALVLLRTIQRALIGTVKPALLFPPVGSD